MAALPKRVAVLFDVDGTLTPSRLEATDEMRAFLAELRARPGVVTGMVGGSDLPKQQEQLGRDVLHMFDWVFPENGTSAFFCGERVGRTSIKDHLGEPALKKLINFVLRYLSEVDIPVKRGTFIEYRQGMLNFCPIGRNCSQDERNEFELFDNAHGVRKAMIAALQKEFPDIGLKYSIGGQISFDAFPVGWDKTFCLQFLKADGKGAEALASAAAAAARDAASGAGSSPAAARRADLLARVAGFDEIHFFGDKTFPGGNDFEIFSHPDVKGHTVTGPEDTMKQVRALFF